MDLYRRRRQLGRDERRRESAASYIFRRAPPSMSSGAATGRATRYSPIASLALDARSGKLIWHYQTVHHDVWEYGEVGCGPATGYAIHQNGQAVDVVAAASKSGFPICAEPRGFAGKPIWPIEESGPVPKSDMPSEATVSPTQPFPTRPPAFARMSYTVKDYRPDQHDRRGT